MKNYLLLLLFTSIMFSATAQNPGDTIIFHTFNYGQTHGQVSDGSIRDTTVIFPDNQNISYEKILMYYSIRCKNGLVSPGVSGQTNIGCGEWDYSCNTYIQDSSRVDSFYSTHANYSVSNFTGTTFNYVVNPTNDYYQYIQKDVSVTGTPVDTLSTVGTGTISNNDFIKSNSFNAKRHYIFTKAELIAAGVLAGNIDGIALDVLNGTSNARFFKIGIKHTTDNTLSLSNLNNTSFTEVYFHNSNLQSSINNFNFHTPFLWDGNSNIIIEYSYYNTVGASSISFASSQLSQNMAALTTDDKTFNFDGTNYIETDTYKGVDGTSDRTIEAWVKTSVANKEIVGYGKDSGGTKWVFRVNGNGTLRVEVNGGSIYGTTILTDNNWHHVACTFSGTQVSDIKLYVDGVLETNTTIANRTINTNTANGINLRISRGINNRYWDGQIDDVRIWDTELSQSTIAEWMHSEINSNHPQYSNLQLNYVFDDYQNGVIIDKTTNGRNAHIVNGGSTVDIKSSELFKNWQLSQNRINTTFMQGNYNLNITNDTILDTIQKASNVVKGYQVISNGGTLLSDEITQTIDTNLWLADDEITYDAITGSIINTQNLTADGNIMINNMTYTKRSAMKLEIMSFVTPYGINLDLGPNGKTYTFDVTDFGPILKGKKRITVERGGQWQEDMDITFAYIVGTPARDVMDIQEIWPVYSKSNADIIADKAFEPRDILMNGSAKSYKIRSTISGHGQEGEFIPRDHHINIDGGNNEFTWTVWNSDCSLNPIYPQGGTWIYDRAGWCPGVATLTTHNEITPNVTPGSISNIDYGMVSATGSSNYIVSNQLVSYGENNFTLDASVTDIITPSNKVEYSRTNIICNNPTIIIKNTGSTDLSSVVIEYWVNNASSRQTYTWNGLLKFDETTEVTLPSNDELWNSLEPSNNEFHVELKNPNNGTDEYSFNNIYNSSFVIPDVVPQDFYILMRTNNAASETSYRLSNPEGEIFLKNGLSNSTLYRDTFKLGVGCYKLEIMDSDDDGLEFFANSDGNGSFTIRTLSNQLIKTIETSFGRKYTYNFTIDYPLSYEDMQAKVNKVEVYPNPTNGQINIKFYNDIAKNIIIYDMLGKVIYNKELSANQTKLMNIDLSNNKSGIYMVQIQFEDRVEQIKVVLQ